MAKVTKETPPEVPPEVLGAPGGDVAKPPKFETPVVAEDRNVPRFVRPIERAPVGLSRYKVRCTSVAESPTHYVLARSEEQAKKFYVEAHGLDKLTEKVKERDGNEVEVKVEVKVAIKRLPD